MRVKSDPSPSPCLPSPPSPSPNLPLYSLKTPLPSRSPTIKDLLTTYPVNLPHFEAIRKHFHANPELSTLETKTAAYIASYLRSLKAFDEIFEGVGGTGVVGVLRNEKKKDGKGGKGGKGKGKVVLLRADMDGLPVKEQTGLEYRSEVRMRDVDGVVKDVMHACGHDTHLTSLLAATTRLITMTSHWTGTLIILFQPAEEHLGGALRMVNDGLFDLIPTPDILLGQHVGPQITGSLGMVPGIQLSASDSLLVTLYGRGGHASQPAVCIDPVLMAANVVVRLQGIVSREVNVGEEFAVVTVGSMRAGDAENVIPDSATLKINVRTIDEGVRARVLGAIGRIVRGEAEASGAPKSPRIESLGRFPVTVNDAAVTERVGGSFEEVFGRGKGGEEGGYRPEDFPRTNGSEDFSEFARAVGKPSCFWFFGGSDPDLFKEEEEEGKGEEWRENSGRRKVKKQIPINHSPFFAPVMEPTLQVGIDAMTAAALTFLMD